MSDHLLSPIITAHCFWSPRCKHTVSDRPDAAHAAMEAHYAAAHAAMEAHYAAAHAAMEAHYAAAHGRDMDRALGVTRKAAR